MLISVIQNEDWLRFIAETDRGNELKHARHPEHCPNTIEFTFQLTFLFNFAHTPRSFGNHLCKKLRIPLTWSVGFSPRQCFSKTFPCSMRIQRAASCPLQAQCAFNALQAVSSQRATKCAASFRKLTNCATSLAAFRTLHQREHFA